MIHALKTLPEYFEAVRKGDKTFELRENDRDFRVGDYLALNEWDGEKYTGRALLAKITYMLDPNDIMACVGGFVILGLNYFKINADNNISEVDNDAEQV